MKKEQSMYVSGTNMTEIKKLPGFRLKRGIELVSRNLLEIVDPITIWYAHTQVRKTDPTHFAEHPNRIDVELSKKHREDCIQELQRIIDNAKACKVHLEY